MLSKWLKKSARGSAGLALALGAWAIPGVSHADSLRATAAVQTLQGAIVMDGKTADDSTQDGKYDLGDSAALQVILEAPAATSDSLENQQVNTQFQVDVTSLQNRGANDPHALSNGGRGSQSGSLASWDFQAAKVVPEPASALLMGIGLAALLMFRQRGSSDDKDSLDQ